MEKYVEELLEKIVEYESKPSILKIYNKLNEIDIDSGKETEEFINQFIKLED